MCLLGPKSIIPELVGRHLPQFVELNFFGEDIQRNVDRTTKTAATLVVVENRIEGGPITVEEVLISQRIKVPDPPCWIAKQRVRKLVQRTKLCLKP